MPCHAHDGGEFSLGFSDGVRSCRNWQKVSYPPILRDDFYKARSLTTERTWALLARSLDFVAMSTTLDKKSLGKKRPYKPRKKPGLLEKAIEVYQLPPLVDRPTAVKFSNLSERTYMRAEQKRAAPSD